MRLHHLVIAIALVGTNATVTSSSVHAAALFTTSLTDWQSAAGTFLNTTSNYGSASTALGTGLISYNPGTVVTVGDTWNTWCCGYTGQAVWTGSTSTTLSVSGLYAFGFQVEPNIYQVESITVTLSNGQTLTTNVGGQGGAQFFGFVGSGITSLTITDNAGDDFAFGNFYSVGTGCPATSAQASLIGPAAAPSACGVKINSADLVSNKVSVSLSGSPGATGKLTVTANAGSTTFSALANNGQAVGPGSYNVSFDRPKMPIGIYSSITAKWDVPPSSISSAFNLTNKWNVFGVIRHSEYNTPNELQCAGASTTAWIVSPECKFTKTTLLSSFIKQAKINGTGESIDFGLVKPAGITIEPTLCKNTKKPPGFLQSMAFFQISSVTGKCNTTLVAGGSVATYPNPKGNDNPNFATCRDHDLLVKNGANLAVKTVHDECPACSGDFRKTNGHVDNYIGGQACDAHSFTDLGNFWTADTHGESK